MTGIASLLSRGAGGLGAAVGVPPAPALSHGMPGMAGAAMPGMGQSPLAQLLAQLKGRGIFTNTGAMGATPTPGVPSSAPSWGG